MDMLYYVPRRAVPSPWQFRENHLHMLPMTFRPENASFPYTKILTEKICNYKLDSLRCGSGAEP